MPDLTPKITPCIWFDQNNAEEAVAFYDSVFGNVRLVSVIRNGTHGPGPKGSVLAGAFEIAGQRIEFINGGPAFRLSEAFSLAVRCDSQAEIDRLWDALVADGGEHAPCGWLKDRFGVSWQIVPRVLYEMHEDPDPARADRVMQAMLQMRKLDIAALERAYAGG
jgi:predicted 3-demethylubiquinone-9 3-methyltransferase (glyoxalase superfamily)